MTLFGMMFLSPRVKQGTAGMRAQGMGTGCWGSVAPCRWRGVNTQVIKAFRVCGTSVPLFLWVPSPELKGRNEEQNEAPITQGEMVSDLLHHSDTHRSLGPDGIHPRARRELAAALTEPTTIICHQSWLTGEVPTDGKVAGVMPIYK